MGIKLGVIFGHGAGDSGACSPFGQEAQMVRSLKPYLQDYFSNYDMQVDYFNDSINWYQHLQKNKVSFKGYDYVIEIHANAGVNDFTGDGKTTGFEVFVTSSEKSTNIEKAMCKNMESLGFKNRGVKVTDFFVIRTIKAQGVSSALMELFFVGDKDDVEKFNTKKPQVASAIGNAITAGFGVKKRQGNSNTVQPIKAGETVKIKAGAFYMVNGGNIGPKVPANYVNKPYKVLELRTLKGIACARLSPINSWLKVSDLYR